MKQIIRNLELKGVGLLVFLCTIFLYGSQPVSAATYEVTNTNDSGAGSFRQAVLDANANSGSDQIDFNIPGAGPHTITLTSGGISVTGTTKINGLSQPGSVCDGSDTDLKVRLNLNGTGNPFFFNTGATDSELNGLAIANAAENAYAFQTVASNTTIRCNFFGTFDGTNVASTQVNSDNVLINAPGAMIGGNDEGDMNLSIAPTSANHRFMFTSEATTINFRNNIVGVTLDGTTAVPGGRMALNAQPVARSSIIISDNLIYSDDPVAAINLPGVSSHTVISGNIIGLNKNGDNAFDDSAGGIRNLSGSDITIDSNHIATKQSGAGILFGGEASDVIVSNNKINILADGQTPIPAASGPGNNALANEYNVSGENWQVYGNHMYATANGALLLHSINGASIIDNIIGMNASKTACLAGASASVIFSSQNVVVGGTDPADANVFCGSYSALDVGSSTGAISALGNTLISDAGKPYSVGPPNLNTPKIIALSENGGSTDVTFAFNNSADDWRIELFENTEAANGGGHPNARTLVGHVDITSSGGPEEHTETIPGTGYENLSITATRKDGSPDGFGDTSEIGPSALEANIAIQTTDGIDSVSEGTEDHEFTQTFTNIGPATVTQISMSSGATECFTIDIVSTSGTATDTGSYDDEYLTWDGLLEPGQSLTLTFTGDVTCNAPDAILFVNVISSIGYGDYQLTNTSDNVDLSDSTDIIGYAATVIIGTTDSVDTIQYDATNHQITQTLYNGGSDRISEIEFNLVDSDCFDVTNATASFGSYDLGTNTWEATGSNPEDMFDAGKTLSLIFTGDISCQPGETMTFTHEVEGMSYNGTTVSNNIPEEESDYTDTTEIIGPSVDLEIETTDGVDSVFSFTQDHEFVQTITNNSDVDITDITFQINTPCFHVLSVSTGGTATGIGGYSEGAWNGLLEQGQNLLITFTGYIFCDSAGGEVELTHTIQTIESNGISVTDTTNDNNDYHDATEIIDNIADTSITQMLTNPGDVAIGEVLEYDLTFTNQGPQPLDISQFDGSFGEYGPLHLTMYFIPPELDYIGYESSDGVACTSFGPGSASMFGPSLGNHSDWEIIMCYEPTGEEHILDEDDSVSFAIQVSPNETSDLDFYTHALSTLGQQDPDGQVMAGVGSSDIIDYLTENPINNFITSVPMVDAAITKTLVGEGSSTPGDIVTYNIAIENKGPMSINLNMIPLEYGVPLFVDIFPADSLSYVSINEDFMCHDLGPGSIAYIGNAGMDHPNHQLLLCGFSGDSHILGVGDTLNLQLEFEVVEGATPTVTNYATMSTVPTDPDSLYLTSQFADVEEDVLDTVENENFSRVSYTAEPTDPDEDGDGISDSVEDEGPNNGDANNDGTPDSEQAHVSSYVSSVTGKRVVLEVSEGCSIDSTEAHPESTNTTKDSAFTYPLGLMGFTLSCGEEGYVADITQYYFNETSQDYVLRKYHPGTNTYFTISDASIANQEIGSLPVVTATYQVADGSYLDTDGDRDGNITDPAGLALQDQAGSDGSLSATGQGRLRIIIMALTLLGAAGGTTIYLIRKHNRK